MSEMTGPDVGSELAGGIALTIQPTKDDVVPTQSQTLLLTGWFHSVHLQCGRRAGCTTCLTEFKRFPLSQRCLSLLPFNLALVVGSVVSPTAAAHKLLL
jgi:hypothetical protein